jgi:hypothetical protein
MLTKAVRWGGAGHVSRGESGVVPPQSEILGGNRFEFWFEQRGAFLSGASQKTFCHSYEYWNEYGGGEQGLRDYGTIRRSAPDNREGKEKKKRQKYGGWEIEAWSGEGLLGS